MEQFVSGTPVTCLATVTGKQQIQFILLDSCPDSPDIQHSLRILKLTIDTATSGSSIVIPIAFRRCPRFVAEHPHLYLHVSQPLFLLFLLFGAPRHLKI